VLTIRKTVLLLLGGRGNLSADFFFATIEISFATTTFDHFVELLTHGNTLFCIWIINSIVF